MKEAGQVEEVVAVSIGVKQAQETCARRLQWARTAPILIVAAVMCNNDIRASDRREDAEGCCRRKTAEPLVLCVKQRSTMIMKRTTARCFPLCWGWSQGGHSLKVDIRRWTAPLLQS